MTHDTIGRTAPAVIPASAVIATRHRPAPFRRTVESLAAQSIQPAEVVVVDGSNDRDTEAVCSAPPHGLRSAVRYHPAAALGAAIQRNQGVRAAEHPAVLFLDDDILFEPECLARMWAALHSGDRVGGVNPTVTNQRYTPPGQISRAIFGVLNGRRERSYAGRVLGPGVNLYPDDRPDQPEVVPVDWLHTTCVLYRRAALPDPPFPPIFTGYSLMEDLALSLVVRRGWELLNARTARIYHDSQPGDHKRSHAELAAMELVNRHFVMADVLGRTRPGDYARFAVWEAFQLATAAQFGPRRLAAALVGKVRGLAWLAVGRAAARPSRTNT